MSSSVPLPPPSQGLPPVKPPSGKFIAQLFLVPGLIVTVAVLVLLFFSWFVGGESAPDELLKRLGDANADIRWRAANDLAQRLRRDDDLASNPKVALRLVENLQARLRDYEEAQRQFVEQAARASDEERQREQNSLRDKRKDIQYLSPCLGNLIIPVGAPLLCEIAKKDQGADEKSLALLRRQAVWSLGNLGDNLKRYDKLSPERKQAVLAEMESEAATGPASTRTSAEETLRYLRQVQDGTSPSSLGVIPTLVLCARAEDPFVREMTAHALNFWHGDAAEERQAERALVQLAGDKGTGKRIEIGEQD